MITLRLRDIKYIAQVGTDSKWWISDPIIEILAFKAIVRPRNIILPINIHNLLCAKYTGSKHCPHEAYILDSSGGDSQ